MTTRPLICQYCGAYDSYGLEPSGVVRGSESTMDMMMVDEDRWTCGICNKEWRVPLPRS